MPETNNLKITSSNLEEEEKKFNLLEKTKSSNFEKISMDNSVQDELKKLFPDFKTSLTQNPNNPSNNQTPGHEPSQTKIEFKRQFDFGRIFFLKFLKDLGRLFLFRLLPAIVFLILITTGIGHILSPETKSLTKADVIVVVTGGGKERINKALELYQQKLAPYLLISGANEDGSQSFMVEEAKNRGVPIDKLLIEQNSTDTHENAVYAEKICEKYKFKKVILVTSTYHQLRLFLSFKGAFRLTQTEFSNAPAPVDFWDWKTWWTNKKGIDTTVSEISKVIYYWQKGYF